MGVVGVRESRAQSPEIVGIGREGFNGMEDEGQIGRAHV